MSVRIGESTMDSSVTKHGARWDGQSGSWKVSWLPGHPLDRNQAVTAMMIAVVVAAAAATTTGESNNPMWPHLDNWAAELGLHRSEVLVQAAADLPKDWEAAW